MHAVPSVRRYKVIKQLGDGTYGSVWKAINRQTNEVVRALARPHACGMPSRAPPQRMQTARPLAGTRRRPP